MQCYHTMKMGPFLSKKLLLVLLIINLSSFYGQETRVEVVLKPNGKELVTDSIQSAIDKCASEGGGVVHFSEGVYN